MTSGRVARFLPSTSGLKFTNRFPSGVPIVNIDLPIGRSIPIGDASNGVCGGMVYAALDLFLATPRLRPPDTRTPPSGKTPLTEYVMKRLVDSFALGYGVGSNVARYLRLMSVPDKDGFVVDGIGSVMSDDEWPKVKRDIDAGRPSPLGIVAGGYVSALDVSEKIERLGHCHQVLAYAYDLSSARVLTLHVYDPNDPLNDNSTIVVDLSDPGDGATMTTERISSRISGHSAFRAFFRHEHYSLKRPPNGVSPGPE
jgi:hypothetical protein